MVDPARVRRLLDILAVYKRELESQLAERLGALAGMRNRLVHLYATVDDAIVHSALADGIDDLNAFARKLAGLADASEDEQES